MPAQKGFVQVPCIFAPIVAANIFLKFSRRGLPTSIKKHDTTQMNAGRVVTPFAGFNLGSLFAFSLPSTPAYGLDPIEIESPPLQSTPNLSIPEIF